DVRVRGYAWQVVPAASAAAPPPGRTHAAAAAVPVGGVPDVTGASLPGPYFIDLAAAPAGHLGRVNHRVADLATGTANFGYGAVSTPLLSSLGRRYRGATIGQQFFFHTDRPRQVSLTLYFLRRSFTPPHAELTPLTVGGTVGGGGSWSVGWRTARFTFRLDTPSAILSITEPHGELAYLDAYRWSAPPAGG